MVKTYEVNPDEAYSHHFTAEELEATFGRYVIGRNIVGKDRVTADKLGKTLNSEIEIILRKVEKCTYHFSEYRQILFLKGAGDAPREICVPTARDALVLAALKGALAETCGPCCQTPKPQAVIASIQEALLHGPYGSYVKLDIKRFYSSIPHHTLHQVLRERVSNKQLLSLIESAIATPSSPMGRKTGKKREVGVPEGLSISNYLANIYLSYLDDTFSGMKGARYFRYVDDILVLCESGQEMIIAAAMKEALGELGLKVNANKTIKSTIAGSSIRYLGYVFNDGVIQIRPQSVRKMEQRLEELIKRYAHAKNNAMHERKSILFKLKNVITGCKWKGEDGETQKFGWIIYYSQTTEMACFAKLDRMIRKLGKRYGADLPRDLPRATRTYYEARYRLAKTRYIPTYGHDTPIEEMRSILTHLGFTDVRSRDDEWVKRAFSRRMQRLCRSLERDVGGYHG